MAYTTPTFVDTFQSSVDSLVTDLESLKSSKLAAVAAIPDIPDPLNVAANNVNVTADFHLDMDGNTVDLNSGSTLDIGSNGALTVDSGSTLGISSTGALTITGTDGVTMSKGNPNVTITIGDNNTITIGGGTTGTITINGTRVVLASTISSIWFGSTGTFTAGDVKDRLEALEAAMDKLDNHTHTFSDADVASGTTSTVDASVTPNHSHTFSDTITVSGTTSGFNITGWP